MSSGSASRSPYDPASALAEVVDRVAHLLPAQGPISVFIHHNPLHAFEHLPFEEAVVLAARKLGCETRLPERHFRAALERGRIAEGDVDAVLTADLGERGAEAIAGPITRFELRRRIALHGFPEARGEALSWLLGETPALDRFREDLPADVREATASGERLRSGASEEETQGVRALWRSVLDAVRRRRYPLPERSPRFDRHRDLLLSAYGIDTDDWIHPLLIRFVSAYLDQGFAHWPMPERERGMYACFLAIYGARVVRLSGPWTQGLAQLVADDRSHDRTALDSLQHSLHELGIPPEGWEDDLAAEALALRGWAGMVRQIEERPDRVPARTVPARLVEFLAVRLLLTRAANAYAARTRPVGPLAALRARLAPAIPPQASPSPVERAWPIFHAAQLCGLDPATIDRLSEAEVTAWENELAEFDSVERRRILQLAYERHLRHKFYDALIGNPRAPEPSCPLFQAVFCIDEREESLRRHLEEIEPAVETCGAPGYFGVAMYFRGATDARPRPLCPVAIQPEHYVAEASDRAPGRLDRWRDMRRRAAGLVGKNVHIGSRTLMRGTVLMATIGVLSIIPLVVRVLFPWLSQRLSRLDASATPRARTRLRLERDSAVPPLGRHVGYAVDEMAEIVRVQLASLGIGQRMSPLIFVIGHASTSLNNPHESAHDCGACGGGRGGPNARAFAQMANDPRVRSELTERGIPIPPSTWFVGAERNTSSNAVRFFDDDLVPETLRLRLARAREVIERAREREAHERCRRFDSIPSWFPPRAALRHVESRAADLAQPRPEYGHATNAFCVIGRRARTRGLFLDRRAFLVSYDPSGDPDGQLLQQSLAAVVPVVAGINLEYYFGHVDPTGTGSGTKLPHNVTGLLGVMDGAQSDLRSGLPWQMLEIHEPVRLTLVVESPRDRLMSILGADPTFGRLVENRWILLARLDPESNELDEFDVAGFRPYTAEHPVRVTTGDSVSYYRRKRGPLPLVRIEAARDGRSPR